MPAQKTIIRKEYAQLAFEHTDMTMNLIAAQAFPPKAMSDDTGVFREGGEAEWYKELETMMSKYTKATEHGESDSTTNFNIVPIATAWKYSEVDLNAPQKFGASSRQDMIQKRIRKEAVLMKKVREKQLYTAVSTTGNFYSSSFYADAAAVWSNSATTSILSDVTTGLLQCPEANAMIINKTTMRYCQQNAALQSLSNVSGKVRDGDIDPTITSEWLKNVFQVDYLFIASGKMITDSSDPTDTTKADIWGNKALLFYYNPGDDDDGRWLQHLYYNGPGAMDEGWVVTETTDPEAGLYGVTRWQLGTYLQFLPHRKELAYCINALYT